MKTTIDLHAIGEKLEFTDARERTGGARSEGLLTLGPGRIGPPAHIHTLQVEGFEVVSGALVLISGHDTVTLRPGESHIVPAGTPHTFRNAEPDIPAVARFWFEPALDIEWMLQTMGEIAMARGGDWKKTPLTVVGCLMFKLRGQYRVAGIPFWAQDLLCGLLTGVAHLTGVARRVGSPSALVPE